MKRLRRTLDLQAKVILILIAVIVPTFVVVTIAENSFTQPVLEQEIRQIGITSGKTLATELVSQRLLSLSNPTPAVEGRIQEMLYAQPNVVRVDVFVKDPIKGTAKMIGTSVEEDPALGPPELPPTPFSETVTSEFRSDDAGVHEWDLFIPIEQHSRDPRGPTRILGMVHVLISTKLVGRIVGIIWETTAIAAGFSVVMLIIGLSYFLRKTINNDRRLRQAETQNLQLTEQLHDTQRQLMNTEKLAVMGQLTASFAHEIGTPLTAIGGHLQLLREELGAPDTPNAGRIPSATVDRLEIINGQVSKIAEIVKSFLQSTAKPTSQRQLVDINKLVDKTLKIVGPRIDSLGVEVRMNMDRELGPLRAVPLDLEQILLNLVNNSLDSLNSRSGDRRDRLMIAVSSECDLSEGKQWARVSVYDTGEGIRKADLRNVLKPFFTTKRPGEGTGLGLTISQELAHKYGGVLEIDSKEGAWTRVTLSLPYEANA